MRCIDTVTITISKMEIDLPKIEIVKQYGMIAANTVFLINSLTSNIPYMFLDRLRGVKVTWDKIKWILTPHRGWSTQYKRYLLNPNGDDYSFD